MTGYDIDRQIAVLLVEDDEESGQALKGMLEKRGMVVRMVRRGEEALSILLGQPSPVDAPAAIPGTAASPGISRQTVFDVLVADIRLDGMSGVDLLRAIREKNLEFPVILLTGYDSLESAVQAVRLGAQDYILKPLDNIDGLMVPLKKAVTSYRLVVNNRILEKRNRDARRQLENSYKEMRLIADRLTELDESERRRLGQELHDQVGQNLAVLGINLNFIRGCLANKPENENAGKEAVMRLDDAILQVEQIAGQIRQVMSDVRPVVLEDYGLLAGLRWYAEQFSRRMRITVDVCGNNFAGRLPPKLEIALYRIAQEALTNTAKHAKAKKVTIELSSSGGTHRLAIRDDGAGFDPSIGKDEKRKQGWGIMLMRERAVAVGGRFRLETAIGKGVMIEVVTGDVNNDFNSDIAG